MADDAYQCATGSRVFAGRFSVPSQPAGFCTAPDTPGQTGGGPSGPWAWFPGTWSIAGESYFDDHGIDMYWGYSRTDPVPSSMRMIIHCHGSSAGTGAGMQSVFAPPYALANQIMVLNPDAEAYNGSWREWWAFDESGTRFPSRRIAGTIEYLASRYSEIDFTNAGIILKGGSMGGGGCVFQSMLLPEPWKSRVAIVTSAIGGVLPRVAPNNYTTWPADTGEGAAFWDSVDFTIQGLLDPVVRSQHYRHRFSSNDPFWNDAPQRFINFCEAQKIAHWASWVQNGHSTTEPGVVTMVAEYPDGDDPNWDVTLDRAHPAITNSTANYPTAAVDRLDTASYPRGHYNLGISCHHGNTVDTSSEIVLPLKYVARTGIGGGIPDQPASLTCSVTPRRPKNFVIVDGETLNWEWDGGVLSGTAVVSGDTVTVDAIPLTSGDSYKTLRIYR